MSSSYFNIFKFVERYLQYPCLWDKTDVNFRNRISRDDAERILVAEFDFQTIKDLKVKIRNIRCTYNQEVVKIKKSETTGNIYKPRLAWFKLADSYLRKNREEENTSRAILKLARGKRTSETIPELNSSQETDINNLYESSVSSKESILPDYMSQQILIKEEIQENEDEEENSAEHIEFMEEAVVQGDEREHDEESYLIKPVIKRQSSRQHKLAKLDNTLEEAISVLKNITSQSLQNEFVVFGRHIGVQLSKLPLETALVLQSDIQNLITKARLDSLQNPTSSTSREHT